MQFSDVCKKINCNILEYYREYDFIIYNNEVTLSNPVKSFQFTFLDNEYEAFAYSSINGKSFKDTFFFNISIRNGTIDHFVGYVIENPSIVPYAVGIFCKDKNILLKLKLAL